MDKVHLDNYLESGGSKCPWCGSEWLQNGEYFDYLTAFNKGRIATNVTCANCERHWSAEYQLVSAQEDENEDEDEIDEQQGYDVWGNPIGDFSPE